MYVGRSNIEYICVKDDKVEVIKVDRVERIFGVECVYTKTS